jgi:hypothetical protein
MPRNRPYKQNKTHPYFIADVIEPFTFSYRGRRGNSFYEKNVNATDVVYVKRSSPKDKTWIVSVRSPNSEGEEIFGIMSEDELINKIKVRRNDENKPFVSEHWTDLYEEHVKPKWDDLTEQEKKSALKADKWRIIEWSKKILEKSKAEMPSLQNLWLKFIRADDYGSVKATDHEDYFSKVYNGYSDNPWCYTTRTIGDVNYFIQPADIFMRWLKEEIRREEISQNKNEKQLKRQKRDRHMLMQGMVPCQRCGGAGGSDAWKYTGWDCFECGGKGYIDPLELEGPSRQRMGLPFDREEAEEYLEKLKSKSNSNKTIVTSSGNLIKGVKMKITKTASGKRTLKISKSEWKAMGKQAGWLDDDYDSGLVDDPYTDFGESDVLDMVEDTTNEIDEIDLEGLLNEADPADLEADEEEKRIKEMREKAKEKQDKEFAKLKKNVYDKKPKL